MTIDRRSLPQYAGVVPLMGAAPRLARAAAEQADEKADHTLRIAAGLSNLHPITLFRRRSIRPVPGPLLRFKEGQRVVVDVPR